jgi:hypothetical protein
VEDMNKKLLGLSHGFISSPELKAQVSFPDRPLFVVRKLVHFQLLLKIFFSRPSRPISIKLDSNHPWVKGILNCSNKGPGPIQRGDNHKNAKMGWGHLKIFSRTTKPQ